MNSIRRAFSQSRITVRSEEPRCAAMSSNVKPQKYLRSTISDARLVVIHARAEALHEELTRRGYRHVDAMLSSLAMGLMSDRERHALLSEISISLRKKGTFTQYQYLHGLQFRDRQLSKFDMFGLLVHYFRSVQRTITWRNLPPAFVFTCRCARLST